jgi:uncharacterized protein (DUF362 family)
MEKNELLIIYGENLTEMAIKLAEEANLAQLIGDRAKKIGIKPNLVMARPASDGATTHPEICLGLVKYLKANGFNNLTILEGSWTGDSTIRAFSQCGYVQFCNDEKVKLIDTQKDRYRKHNCAGVEIEICDSAMNIDFMINVPVLKGHCQTLLTCALKNNKGLIPDREKRRFHTIGLHKPIAHLNTVIRNDFIVVDGICGDPDFENGGNPVYGGRLIAARDPVLVDAWAANQLGRDVSEIPYIGLAEKLKIGIANLKKASIRELSAPAQSSLRAQSGQKSPAQAGKAKKYARYIQEADACSACYASLVYALSRLSEAELERIKPPLCIGQGFRGRKGEKGIGQCTGGFTSCCAGCPPSGAEVLAFLRG